MDDPHSCIEPADLGVPCVKPWTSVEERDVAGLHTVCCDLKEGLGHVARDAPAGIVDFARGPARAAMQRSILDRTYRNCKEACPLLRGKSRPRTNGFYQYEKEEYAAFPEAFRRNRERLIDLIARQETSGDTHPVKLKVHPSGRCNFRCPMCFEDKAMRSQVDPAYIQRIYAAMPYLEELKVFGGEPFACKVSREIVFSAELQQHPQIHLSMITNGSLLDEPVLRLFERQRLGFILFSLDSPDAATYEKVRVRGRLGETMAGISNFLERRALGRIRVQDVSFSMTIQRENLTEIAAFVRFANAHAVSATFGLVNGFDHLLDELPRVRDSLLEGIAAAEAVGDGVARDSLQNLLETLPGYRTYLEQVRERRRQPRWMWDLVGDERMERLKSEIERRPRVLTVAKAAVRIASAPRTRVGTIPGR